MTGRGITFSKNSLFAKPKTASLGRTVKPLRIIACPQRVDKYPQWFQSECSEADSTMDRLAGADPTTQALVLDFLPETEKWFTCKVTTEEESDCAETTVSSDYEEEGLCNNGCDEYCVPNNEVCHACLSFGFNQ